MTDIAGLVRGAAEGQGLGNAFLSHISAVDGLFHVVSCCVHVCALYECVCVYVVGRRHVCVRRVMGNAFLSHVVRPAGDFCAYAYA